MMLTLPCPAPSIAFAVIVGLWSSVTFAQTTVAPKPAAPTAAKPAPEIPADAQWHDVTTWGVEGRGWGDQERKRWFDRLPAKAEGRVTDAVWNLSRDSAGMMARFKTDAQTIYARYTVSKKQIGMPHMPATGVSGLDLYARDDSGKWRWVMVTKPTEPKVEDRRNTNSWILPDRDKHHDANHAALKAAYEKLVNEGVKGLSYIEGDHLYGDDAEGATDASHASDLGFMRQADIFEPILRAALESRH